MVAKINWNPSHKDIRIFGAVFWVGCALIAGFLYSRELKEAALWVGGAGIGIGVLALLVPLLAKPFYFLWMMIGFVMGSIMSRVILILIFYVVLTPVALVFRLIKRDALRLKKTSESGTYWVEHPVIQDKSSYDHLF